MVLPPVKLGAVKVTVAVVKPAATADTEVGAADRVMGVTLLLALLADPVPIKLAAVTVKV
jgi:hypothetical protein